MLQIHEEVNQAKVTEISTLEQKQDGLKKKIDEKKILVLYRLACLGFIMSAITIMVCIP